MDTKNDSVQERNREIGQILQAARTKRNISITTCAQSIGTSRRRYAAMEDGETLIGFAELEVLMTLLDIPPSTLWKAKPIPPVTRRLVLDIKPEEVLEIIVNIRPDN
jgi:transcriptional regulator with XRE-family HTH domain